MDFIQIQAYVGVWAGAVIMITFHNLIVSAILYKARQTNISNILKFIFNFGQIVQISGNFGLYMTPKLATETQCSALLYYTTVGNIIKRTSLTAFLLWRLRQIHNDRIDTLICTVLFVARTVFAIPYLIFQRPLTEYVPGIDVVICNVDDKTPLIFGVSGIVVEVLADLYVTIRLVQILNKANRNAAQLSSNVGRKSKRTLFTAVIYWNFLRLLVSFVFHLTGILDQVKVLLTEESSITLKCIIYILLTYVITVDAEIVRVIEGKDKKKDSSAGTEKSFKSMSQSPRTPRIPPHYGGHSSNDLPKYSPPEQSHKVSSNDEDEIVVVSMKRLSFFEWANVVSGKSFSKNDEDEQYEDEDIEEIIDGPSEKDSEKGSSQDRRNSNFSGTTSMTETTTLDGNPDIVIH